MKIQITITLLPGEEMPEINLSPPSPAQHHRESALDAYVESAVSPIPHSQPIGFRA